MLMSIKSPPRMVGIPTCVESVAKVMAELTMPKPQCKSRRLNGHPFVDNIAQECNEVHRVSEECERLEDDMDSHGASTQDSLQSAFIIFVIPNFVMFSFWFSQ